LWGAWQGHHPRTSSVPPTGVLMKDKKQKKLKTNNSRQAGMLPRRPRPANQVILIELKKMKQKRQVAAAIYNSATLHGGDQDSGQGSSS